MSELQGSRSLKSRIYFQLSPLLDQSFVKCLLHFSNAQRYVIHRSWLGNDLNNTMKGILAEL